MRAGGFKQAAAIVLAAAVFAVVLDLALVSAFDQPSPHHLSVAVTGTAGLVGRLQSSLNAHHPGAFALHPYPNRSAARSAVLDRRVVGAVVLTAHRFQLLLAGAGGASPARALTAAFGVVAAATGGHLTVVDLAPPAPGDAQALSPFFVVLGMLFPSLATGVASSLAAPRASTKWRLGLLVTTAVLMGLVVAAVAEGLTGLGSYPAMAGIVALFSLAVSAPTAGLSRIKRPAVALAVVIFMILGISSSGGPSGLGAFAPGFFRAIDTSLPVGAAATVLRNAVYFHGHATIAGLGVLAAWAAGGLAVLVAAGRIPKLRQSAGEAPINSTRRFTWAGGPPLWYPATGAAVAVVIGVLMLIESFFYVGAPAGGRGTAGIAVGGTLIVAALAIMLVSYLAASNTAARRPTHQRPTDREVPLAGDTSTAGPDAVRELRQEAPPADSPAGSAAQLVESEVAREIRRQLHHILLSGASTENLPSPPG